MHEKDRVVWVDVARGIAILTVLIQNLGFVPAVAQDSLWGILTRPFNILIFAYLGGVVFRNPANIIHFIRRRMHTLLYPYYAAGIISFIGWLFLIRHEIFALIGFPTENFLQFLAGNAVTFNGALWFLPAYFISSIMYVFIHDMFKSQGKETKIILLMVLAVLFYAMNKIGLVLPFSADLAILFLFFTIVRASFEKKIHNTYLFPLLVTVFVVSSLLNGPVGIYGRDFNNHLLFLISALSGCMVLEHIAHAIADRLPKVQKFFSFTGKMSLLLLIIHWPILHWLTFILWKVGFIQDVNINVTLSDFTFTGLSCMPICITRLFFVILYFVLVYSLSSLIHYKLFRRAQASVQ
jgi:fucose 4-O-acetylase-like acetyltransferase